MNQMIWLIRHGESVSNAGLQTTHPAASKQTPLGHRQAAAVAQAFNKPPGLIVVSRYVRSQQAAAPTQARFPQVPVEEWQVHEFTYLASEALRRNDRGISQAAQTRLLAAL